MDALWEQVKQAVSDKEKETKERAIELLNSRISARSFAQSGDCYSIGLMVLYCITGWSMGDFAEKHRITLAQRKRPIPSNEALLFDCIRETILEVPDNAQVFQSLWALRGGGCCDLSTRHAKRWSGVMQCLRGLLSDTQEGRWNASQACKHCSKL